MVCGVGLTVHVVQVVDLVVQLAVLTTRGLTVFTIRGLTVLIVRGLTVFIVRGLTVLMVRAAELTEGCWQKGILREIDIGLARVKLLRLTAVLYTGLAMPTVQLSVLEVRVVVLVRRLT